MLLMHNNNHVCFKCRVTFKKGSICPYCNRHLISCGHRWRFPKKEKFKEWNNLIVKINNINPYIGKQIINQLSN